MPRFISKNGDWKPAKEKVALTNPKTGEPFVYEGPDRAAQEMMKEMGVTSLGTHFSQDPEWINRVRQLYSMSMPEYMKMMGYDEKTSLEEFEKKMKEVNLHSDPKRNKAARQRSGGANTAGNSGHYEGDFGDLQDAQSLVK